jgi:hypothetical protein
LEDIEMTTPRITATRESEEKKHWIRISDRADPWVRFSSGNAVVYIDGQSRGACTIEYLDRDGVGRPIFASKYIEDLEPFFENDDAINRMLAEAQSRDWAQVVILKKRTQAPSNE